MAFTDSHLFFDDVAVGQEWESQGRTVTEADVVNFAGLSGDFNPIHVDHEFARTTPFRRPIAHGMLVMAIGSGLGTLSPPMRTLAFLGLKEWRFAGAVFPGDTIRVRTKVVGKELRGRGKRGEVVWHRSIINQEGKVVQDGTSVTLVACRPPKRDGDELPTPVEST
jgi:3-hydroxybutyryl-CoA dehydratase